MPRARILMLVFVVSLLVFGLWRLPAAPVLAQLDGVQIDGQPLQLERVQGRIWDGKAQWAWADQQGHFGWALAWRGLRPGANLVLTSAAGSLRGWATGTPSRVTLEEVRVDVALAPLSRGLGVGQAEGEVLGLLSRVSWQRSGLLQVDGVLHYGGGSVRWQGGGAEAPPLEARLFNEGEVARMVTTAPDGATVADAQVKDGLAQVRVYRVWPRLLGVSQGGSDEDVVFEVSQPLVPSGGQS